MYAPAKIILRSYIPTFITVGMYFKTTKSYVQYGNETPIEQIWVCEVNVDMEETDEFIARHGAPVEPVICMQIDDNPDVEAAIVATHDQFGFMDYDDTLYPIEKDDINYLLREYGGHVAIYMSDDKEDEIHLEDGKIVLCPLSDIYDDDEEEN